jgi:hypothetical protein
VVKVRFVKFLDKGGAVNLDSNEKRYLCVSRNEAFILTSISDAIGIEEVGHELGSG